MRRPTREPLAELDLHLGPLVVRLRGPRLGIGLLRTRFRGFGARNREPEVTVQLPLLLAQRPPAAGPVQRQSTVSRGPILTSASFTVRGDAEGRQLYVEGPGWIDGAVAALQLGAAQRLGGWPGVLVHGALVRGPQGGQLFFGPSGAGKSTVARSAGPRALCDELVAVTAEARGFRAWATPFHSGRFGVQRLSAIYQLARGGGCSVRPLAPAAAVRALLAEVLLPEAPEARQRLLDLLSRLVGEVPVHTLRFAPGAALSRFLEGRTA